MTLDMWVVYKRPRDYPMDFVVRRWQIGHGRYWPTNLFSVHRTVEDARAAIPDNTTRVQRFPDDDPAIFEVWL